MDLGSRLDQVLQVGARQEVPQVDEFAMVLILDIDDAPSVLTAADRAPSHDDVLLRADDGKGDEVFHLGVGGTFVLVVLVVVVGEHTEVVKGEFFLDARFEGLALFEGEGVGFGDDGDDVDDIGELLEDDDIDGL